MKIIAKNNGVSTELEIPSQPLTAIVHPSGIKVEAPSAYGIDSQMTIQCMKDMSQRAWEHISTGPLFPFFFNDLFKQNPVTLPLEISVLLADYDEGVIHGCGLIVLLCEAVFAGKPEIYLKHPENHLHPACQQMLMTVIMNIQKMSGPSFSEAQPIITVGE